MNSKLKGYCDSGVNYHFPVSVLGRIAECDDWEQHKAILDALLENGTTITPDVASALIEHDRFELFKYIFEHPKLPATREEERTILEILDSFFDEWDLADIIISYLGMSAKEKVRVLIQEWLGPEVYVTHEHFASKEFDGNSISNSMKISK